MRPQEETGKNLWVLVLAEPGSELARRLFDVVSRASPKVRAEVPESAREAARLLNSTRWHLILWHVTGPFYGGLHGLEQLRNRQPDAFVVAVVSHGDVALATRAVAAGADCYALGDDEAALRDAVQAAVKRITEDDSLVAAGGASSLRRADVLAALCQDAVFVTSPAGTVIRANKRAQELTGRPLEKLLGVPLADLFHPREVVAEALAAAACGHEEKSPLLTAGEPAHGQPGQILEFEAFLLQESGSFLLVRLSFATILAEPGRVAEIVAVATPKTPHERLLDELREAQTFAGLVAGTVSEAIAVVDASGVVVTANPAMARLVGLNDPLDCVGLSVDDIAAEGNLRDAIVKALRDRRPVAAELRLSGVGRATTQVSGRVLPVGDAETGLGRALLVLEPPAAEAPKEAAPWAAPALRRAVEAAMHEAAGRLETAVENLLQVAAEAFPGAGVGLVVVASPRPLAVWRGFSQALGQAVAAFVLSRLARASQPTDLDVAFVADLGSHANQAMDAGLVAALAGEGWKGASFVPLALADRVLGMFVVATATGRRQELDETLLEQFTLYLSMALALLSEQSLAEKERQWLEQFAKLSNEVGLIQELDRLVDFVAQETVRIFEADWAAVYLAQPADGSLEIAARAEAGGRSASGTVMPNGAFEAALKALQETAPIVQAIPVNGGEATVAAARLWANGEAAGALVVGWNDNRVLDESAKRTLELVARRVGTAIRHARVYEEEASRASQMRAAAAEAMEVEARARSLLWAASAAAELTDLNRVLWTLTDAGLRAVNVEEIRIYLADHEAGVLRGATVGRAPDVIEPLDHTIPLQRAASVRADAVLSEAPYIVSVVNEGDKSYEAALIPLRTHSALVGLLEGGNPGSGRPVPPRDMRLLRMLASLAAVAIDRARMDALREAMERSVSHELRTPLSSIRAYTELLLDEAAGPINDEQRLFLQRVATACDYLQTLVEDLLDLSRLRAGEVQVRPTLLDLRELVEEVLDRLGQRIEEAGASVSVDVAAEVANVVTDPTRLAQILTNLIDNAVKFSPPPARVAVRAMLDGSDVAIAVTDNGPGIPESEREAIFREFYRGKSDLAQSRAGAGLGLAIARRVARLLGGDLTVESEAGRGSTFWLRFPYRYPELSGEEDHTGAETGDASLAKRPEHPDHRG